MESWPPVRDDRRSSSVKRSGADAFTLVELVIVIVILGIVGAIVMPRFSSAHGRYQLDAIGRRFEADLRHVQRSARSKSGPVKVTFDVGRDRYLVTGAEDPLAGGAGYEVDMAEEPYGVDLEVVTGGVGSVWTFDGNGYFGGGSVVVRVGRQRMMLGVQVIDGAPVNVVRGTALVPKNEVLVR